MRKYFYILKFLKLKFDNRKNKNVILPKKGKLTNNTNIEASNTCKFKLGKSFYFNGNNQIRVREGANLEIGDNLYLNNNTIITCRYKIKIGNNVMIGPNVTIFDHDHDYKSDNRDKNFLYGEIVIGNNVWIGANAVILKGAHIGDNCVAAAGSIIRGFIPENTVAYSKYEIITKNINYYVK